MKTLTACLVLLSTVAMAGRARACGSGGGGGGLALAVGSGIAGFMPDPTFVWVGAVTGAGVADLALTVNDLRLAARHQRPRRTDGLAEILTSLPTLAVAVTTVAVTASSVATPSEYPPPAHLTALFAVGVIEAAWSTALLAHGIWAASGQPAGRDRAAARAPTLAVGPTMSRDGGGLAALGRF